MKIKLIIIVLLFFNLIIAQTKFKVVQKETETWRSIYSLVDENENVIRVLDSTKYLICFNIENYSYFAVFGIKGQPGWIAIDANENILFQVYNTSFGEPTPDYLIENKIRIIDKENRIGFANELGKIIIKPQFEIATSFHNGKAIIGQKCEKVPWEKHTKEEDCHHYSIICGKHGYIDEKGEIIKLGKYQFEDIMKEIDWKPNEEY